MRGIERLKIIERTTSSMAKALPELPMPETVMIRLLRVAGSGLDDYFINMFLEFGLTEKSYHVLCILVASKNQQAYPSALSELIGTSRANMTKLLTRLEKQNLISREVGENDARRNIVRITKQGLAIVHQATPEIAQPVRQAFSGLTANELANLDTLLRKLVASFDNAHNKLS